MQVFTQGGLPEPHFASALRLPFAIFLAEEEYLLQLYLSFLKNTQQVQVLYRSPFSISRLFFLPYCVLYFICNIQQEDQNRIQR